MNRQEIYSVAYHQMKNHYHLALELATGTGKSKIAIDLTNAILSENKDKLKVLILVAKTVHKQNWLDEIKKWRGFRNNPDLTIECYHSLKKHENEQFDIVIADEAHHLNSDMRQYYFRSLKVKYRTLFLSATFPKDFKQWLISTYHPAWIKASLQDTIADGILPEPEILLLPLTLDNKVRNNHIILNKQSGVKPVKGVYKDLWKYLKFKTYVDMEVTQKERLLFYNAQILKMKNYYQRSGRGKLQWLRLCADRLKYLAYAKNNLIYNLLQQLNNRRTLTFCNSIEQTEILGKYCIHSKEKKAASYLLDFNEGKINHITACQMLNEGMNLYDCQYGIFANLNASKIINIQRFGRLLRHKHPIIIIPYYQYSREEEIVKTMIEGYDKKLIHTFQSYSQLISYLKTKGNNENSIR